MDLSIYCSSGVICLLEYRGGAIHWSDGVDVLCLL